MSAYQPEDVGLTTPPIVIMNDRECVGCGYNLKGLKETDKCPECGRKIARPRVGKFAENMVAAPLEWLEFFSWGAFLLFVAVFGQVAVLVVALVAAAGGEDIDSPVLSAIFAIFPLCWCAGVFIATSPRPVMPSTRTNPVKEWAALRWACRFTQFGWVVGTLLALVSAVIDAQGGNAGAALGWMEGGAKYVGLLGLVPLCVYMSNIAFWASDSSLAYGLRTEAWMIGWAIFMYTGLAIELALGFGLGAGFFGAVLSLVWFISLLAPLLWGAACVWRFNSMAKWAVLNHVTAEGRDMRIREKARRAIEREEAEEQRQRREAVLAQAQQRPAGSTAPAGAAPARASAPSRSAAVPPPPPTPDAEGDRPLNPYDVA